MTAERVDNDDDDHSDDDNHNDTTQWGQAATER